MSQTLQIAGVKSNVSNTAKSNVSNTAKSNVSNTANSWSKEQCLKECSSKSFSSHLPTKLHDEKSDANCDVCDAVQETE